MTTSVNYRQLIKYSLIPIFLVACSDQGISFELGEVRYGEIKSWIGSERSTLERAWEDEPRIQEQEDYTGLTWVISPPIDTAKIKEQDWDSGPSTEGFDNDLLSFMRNSISKSCMAVFTIDKSGIVVEAMLQRFKGADDCDTSRIPNLESAK
jgi:hypothetical protein